MAKILIADDNSNVQKTVTLALANLGIDVLAVNNGESAVRKLAEFAPDLVLADIFMPVRNGYEVCEYVKKDSRFSHVPVVLLVGAFDPLDEREAQRVGADGILKKPFVPPDPLITMVKMLLDRSMGERLVEVSVSNATVAARARSSESGIAGSQPVVAVASEEAAPLEFPRPAERVAFEEGEHPVAFSQMLETPEGSATAPAADSLESVDDEQILTSSRDATLGDPIFWRNDEPESETQPVADEHVDEVSASLGVSPWKQEDISLPRRDETPLLQPIEPLVPLEQKPSDSLELIREEQDETSPSIVESGSILMDAASQDQLTVDADKAKELAANPLEWMATAPPIHLVDISPEQSAEHSPELALERSEGESDATPGWDEPIPDASDTIDATEKAELSPTPAAAPEQASAPVTTEVAFPAAPAQTSADSTQPDAKLAGTAPEPNTAQPSIPPVARRPEDTARSVPKQDWVDLTASIRSRANELVPQKVSIVSKPAEPISARASENLQPEAEKLGAVSSPDPALVEAVVQRVLEKMRPQVVDIITKEFLRPIVQALVTREIDKH